MHDAAHIVAVGCEALVPAEVTVTTPHLLTEILLSKVVLHPRPDVLPADPHVVVPVQPGLLVPEAQTVEQLVEDNTVVDTASAQ